VKDYTISLKKVAVNIGILIVPLLSFSTSFAEEVKAKVIAIPVHSTDKIYTLATKSGKSYSCMQSGTTIAAGTLSKSKKKFTSLAPKYKNDIAALNLKVKEAKLAGKPKAGLKFKKAVLALKAEWSSMTTACSLAFNCTVQTESNELSMKENAELEFDLSATTNCDAAPAYKITEQPAKGSLFGITASKFNYHAGFNTGTVSLKYQACVESYGKCSEISEIKINISAGGDEIGRPDHFENYRNTISRQEAKHLLKKIALNDNGILTDDLKSGNGYSLDALLNKLIFSPNYTTPDLRGALETMRDTQRGGGYKGVRDVRGDPVFTTDTFETPEKQIAGLEKFTDNFNRAHDQNWHWNHLGYTPAATTVIFRSRYLAPLTSQMVNLWYGHFGTAIHNQGYFREYNIRDYMKLIQDNAIGNFKKLVLGDNATSCLNGTGGGIICDAASNFWLSNIFNKYNAPNQNFGRELMEIYLLSPKDQYTGERNYTEEDVAASTAFTSGYREEEYVSTYRSTQTNWPAPNPVPIYLTLSNPGQMRVRTIFDQKLHDFKEYTAFKGKPFEFKGTRTIGQFVEYLFDNHPALPRFIAGKLFRMLAYPDPSPELIQKLADRFKGSNYDIADLIKAIASSEAMFSPKAVEPKCIKEPFKILMETFRNLNLPIFSTRMFDDPNAWGNNWYLNGENMGSVNLLYMFLWNAGEKPLLYESVFTHDYCGRNPQSFGQRWTFSVYLGKRIKGMLRLMYAAVDHYWPVFAFPDILKHMLVKGETIYAITPSRLITFFNDLYGIELSPEEYEVIERYITSKPKITGPISNEKIEEVPIGWNASDDFLTSEKIAGLIVIYSSMSQSNVL
jgi:hypothetical protein